MNLLVSDYDDTFYLNRYNIKLNVRKIHEFRNAGNLFAIATGRGFQSIKAAIKEHSIPYDYLICMDGAATFDQQDNILGQYPFNDNENNLISAMIDSFPRFKLSSNFTATNNSQEIIGYSLLSPYYKTLKEFIIELKRELPNIDIHGGFMYCLINKILMNKSIAIQHLSNTLDIPKEDIFTIGNDKNDYEMVRDFNGYKMLIHHPILNGVAQGTYTSVYKLTDDIMHGVSKIKEK